MCSKVVTWVGPKYVSHIAQSPAHSQNLRTDKMLKDVLSRPSRGGVCILHEHLTHCIEGVGNDDSPVPKLALEQLSIKPLAPF